MQTQVPDRIRRERHPLRLQRSWIATPGFSLISACLHFRKKMLLLPIQGQYEQMVNAYYVQKLRLGLFRRQLDADSLAARRIFCGQMLAHDVLSRYTESTQVRRKRCQTTITANRSEEPEPTAIRAVAA